MNWRLMRPGLVVLATTGTLIVAAGIAYAAIPDTSSVIHGCFKTNKGDLRVIDPSAGGSCLSSETPLNWNQTGPKGTTGMTGAQGPVGSQGPQGQQGPQGPSGSSHGYSTYTNTIFVNGGAVFPTTVASLTVSAGNYVVWAHGMGAANHDLTCSIDTSNGTVASQAVDIDSEYSMMATAASVADNSTISVDCTTGTTPGVQSFDHYLVAMKVDAVN
jgi:hypothetical protein